MTHVLELNNVSVALERTVIVRNISLHLDEGMIGCLLGPSGCGKTTLLRAIAGFEPALEGEIRIAGDVVSNPQHSLPVIEKLDEPAAGSNRRRSNASNIRHLAASPANTHERQLAEADSLVEKSLAEDALA